jgi:hypothetical protein
MRTSLSGVRRNYGDALTAAAVGFAATTMAMIALSLFFA